MDPDFDPSYDIDLDLPPDGSSDDDFMPVDDDPYVGDPGIAPDDEDDDVSDDLDESAVDEAGRKRSFGDILKSWLSPKTRLAFKKLNFKVKSRKLSLKGKTKLQHDMLKAKAKQLGKLSLALLALKLMMDHHSDEINREDIKELNMLQKKSSKKKSSGRPQPAMLLALSGLQHKQVNKVLGDMNQSLKAGQGAVQAVGNALNTKINTNALRNGSVSGLDKLANDIGFNPQKIHQSFDSMISTIKSGL